MIEKKIGFIKVGTLPHVVDVLVNQLVDNLVKNTSTKVMGIQTKGFNSDFLEYRTLKDSDGGTKLCSLSYSLWAANYSNLMEDLDILFVFYNEEELKVNQTIFKQYPSCRVLMVPINIFNEQNPFMKHIGYDSAINEVINNIYKVEDTASSLLFTNKRLFLIKIPGRKSGNLLKEAALALQCGMVEKGSIPEFERVKKNLQEKYNEGNNYAFLIFNDAVNEKEIKDYISSELDLDFRSVMIEEAQCIGGNATVRDRIYAIKLAEKMLQWTLSDHLFGTVQLEIDDQIKIDARI
jgi:hypothetical protein